MGMEVYILRKTVHLKLGNVLVIKKTGCKSSHCTVRQKGPGKDSSMKVCSTVSWVDIQKRMCM